MASSYAKQNLIQGAIHITNVIYICVITWDKSGKSNCTNASFHINEISLQNYLISEFENKMATQYGKNGYKEKLL